MSHGQALHPCFKLILNSFARRRPRVQSTQIPDKVDMEGTEEANLKKKMDRLNKDPNAPRRPSNSFLLFAQEERVKILEDLGPITVGEIGTELGKRWGRLDKGEKDKYITKSEMDMSRYKKEMETYKLSESYQQMKTMTKRKKKDLQSKALEDYFQFLASQWKIVSSSNPGVSPVHVQDLVWQKWNKKGDLTTMMRDSFHKREKNVTKKQDTMVLMSERGMRDSPWM